MRGLVIFGRTYFPRWRVPQFWPLPSPINQPPSSGGWIYREARKRIMARYHIREWNEYFELWFERDIQEEAWTLVREDLISLLFVSGYFMLIFLLSV